MLSLCVVTMIADVLKLPDWVAKLSPFKHVATQPGATVLTGATVALIVIAAAGLLVAAMSESRRDLAA